MVVSGIAPTPSETKKGMPAGPIWVLAANLEGEGRLYLVERLAQPLGAKVAAEPHGHLHVVRLPTRQLKYSNSFSSRRLA